MNKKPRRLTLHRETLLRLDETKLRILKGGGAGALYPSDEPNCMSPLCGPTYWPGCEETQ
jgi:hypothetical protein